MDKSIKRCRYFLFVFHYNHLKNIKIIVKYQTKILCVNVKETKIKCNLMVILMILVCRPLQFDLFALGLKIGLHNVCLHLHDLVGLF